MRKADNLPPSCAVVTKSGSLKFLEPSGPVQACNGTDFTLISHNYFRILNTDREGFLVPLWSSVKLDIARVF